MVEFGPPGLVEVAAPGTGRRAGTGGRARPTGDRRVPHRWGGAWSQTGHGNQSTLLGFGIRAILSKLKKPNAVSPSVTTAGPPTG